MSAEQGIAFPNAAEFVRRLNEFWDQLNENLRDELVETVRRMERAVAEQMMCEAVTVAFHAGDAGPRDRDGHLALVAALMREHQLGFEGTHETIGYCAHCDQFEVRPNTLVTH